MYRSGNKLRFLVPFIKKQKIKHPPQPDVTSCILVKIFWGDFIHILLLFGCHRDV